MCICVCMCVSVCEWLEGVIVLTRVSSHKGFCPGVCVCVCVCVIRSISLPFAYNASAYRFTDIGSVTSKQPSLIGPWTKHM